MRLLLPRLVLVVVLLLLLLLHAMKYCLRYIQCHMTDCSCCAGSNLGACPHVISSHGTRSTVLMRAIVPLLLAIANIDHVNYIQRRPCAKCYNKNTYRKSCTYRFQPQDRQLELRQQADLRQRVNVDCRQYCC